MVILFDVDNTLLDDAAAVTAAATALHLRLALPEPLESFLARWRQSQDEKFKNYLAGKMSFREQRRARIRDALSADVTPSDADTLFDEYLAAYEAHWTLFDDVLPVLDALSEHPLGVVSNGQSSQQLAKLSRLGILERFCHVVVADAVGFAKPDSRIFAHACALFDVQPRSVIHVGDCLQADVFGAFDAGVSPVWLKRQGDSTEANHQFRTIHTLSELPALVGSAGGSKRALAIGGSGSSSC